MDINIKYLYSAGAEEKTYNSGETIFAEGNRAFFYFQLLEGKVKLCNQTKEGKEFIQNIIIEGQCFGESLLFNNKEYPMDAIALDECRILKLYKTNFIAMLESYPQMYGDFCRLLSERIHYQHIMLQVNSLLNPAERMIGLMDYLKRTQKDQAKYSFKVPFTRQQIANLTGICVETAIRTLKNMEKNQIVEIRERKIFF